MRRGAKANLEQRLRAIADQATKAADDLLSSKEGPPFEFSVGWGSVPEAIISIDDRPAHRSVVEGLVDSAIWALFESCRGEPDDPKAFARVMDRINAEARKRCHQRPATPPSSTEGESKR